MRSKKVLNVVETHTGGQPTRTVLSGVLQIPGATMWEKYCYMQEKGDWVRTMVCQEPRGSEIMSGTLLTTPCDPQADVGILHFEAAGWLPMCGHNTIGACTAIVEEGLVEVTEPETYITLETPIGLIRAVVAVENGCAKSVSFRNVPAFALLREGTLSTEDWGDLTFDIGWGGSAVAFIAAERFGKPICLENAKFYEGLADMLRPMINEKYPIHHPEIPHITGISHVAFYEDGDVMRHVVVGPDGRCDRSPCGNGTCARAAVLFDQGKLAAGDAFEQHSLIDSVFTCKCVEPVMAGETKAMVPEISGRAWLTSLATYILDDSDSLGKGFLLV